MEAPSRADAKASSLAGGSQLQLSKCDEEDMSLSEELYGAESMPMEWTGGKHDSYLNSMEASFTNQLHHSMNLLSEYFKNDNLSDAKPSPVCSNIDACSGQFKVQQDGRWKKLSFNRPGADVSRELHLSPWIQHFKSVSKISEMECGYSHKITASTGQVAGKAAVSSATMEPVHLSHSQLSHQVVYSNTDGGGLASAGLGSSEVSDQNFVCEDGDEENRRAICRAQGAISSSDQEFKLDCRLQKHRIPAQKGILIPGTNKKLDRPES